MKKKNFGETNDFSPIPTSGSVDKVHRSSARRSGTPAEYDPNT